MDNYQDIKIKTDSIKVDQFLKWANIVSTGGEAKFFIKEGNVQVNGEVEKRRSHQLANGDIVKIKGENVVYRVVK